MKKLSLLLATIFLLMGLASCAKEGAVIGSIEDLDGKRIGVQLNTTGHIYAEDIEGAQVMPFPKGIDAVMDLRAGRVDAVIIDDQPAKVFVSQYNDIKILEEPFEDEEYAICIAKDNNDLLTLVNGAIAELKADGTLQGLLDFYINGIEGSSPYTSPAGTEYPNGVLRMGTNAAFPPYEYYDEDSKEIVGLDPDFARAICDKLGYRLEIVNMDFDAIILSVQTGRVDFGMAGMTVTEDRLKNINFSQSYCQATQVIIVKK